MLQHKTWAADDAEIRRLHTSYVYLADRARAEEIAGLFAVRGSLRVVGGAYDGLVHNGASAISTYFASVVDDLVEVGVTGSHRHHVSPSYIEFMNEDSAWTESYFSAMRASGVDHWGVYRDRLMRVEGEWRFFERVVQIDGTSADSWQHRVGELRKERGY